MVRSITREQATAKQVDAIKALKACHPDDWFAQVLVITLMCYEKLEHSISAAPHDPTQEKIAHDLIAAMCAFGNANKDDWMARVGRIMLLVDLSGRRT